MDLGVRRDCRSALFCRGVARGTAPAMEARMRDFRGTASVAQAEAATEAGAPRDPRRDLAMRRRAIQRKAAAAPPSQEAPEPEAAAEGGDESLEVSSPDDAAEKEADAIADQVADGK